MASMGRDRADFLSAPIATEHQHVISVEVPVARPARVQLECFNRVWSNKMQRRLATILVADVVGYSRLMEAAEEPTAARLQACQHLMSAAVVAADGLGRYDLLSEAVTKIVEHSKSDRPATIITLGDYVDRGPKSRQVIERLVDWGSPDLKLVCLKGNHEDIMRQCCRQPIKAGWWMDNGGGAT
jgi:class 3 adenylate cyclase